jgi:hypothetical protein
MEFPGSSSLVLDPAPALGADGMTIMLWASFATLTNNNFMLGAVTRKCPYLFSFLNFF